METWLAAWAPTHLCQAISWGQKKVVQGKGLSVHHSLIWGLFLVFCPVLGFPTAQHLAMLRPHRAPGKTKPRLATNLRIRNYVWGRGEKRKWHEMVVF